MSKDKWFEDTKIISCKGCSTLLMEDVNGAHECEICGWYIGEVSGYEWVTKEQKKKLEVLQGQINKFLEEVL